MIYAKKEKKPKTTVLYDVEEFIYGRKDFVTDCPFGEKGRYTMSINKVGDLGCNTCEWQLSHNPKAQIVKCSHPKNNEQNKKKMFNW